MASNDTLIEIEDLTKVFYTDEVETHALSGIHLSIARGEYVAMSGPSGCGKSTLLSILGLLDTPTGGKYLLNNNPVENLSFGDRSRIRNQEIGFIFQSFNLIGDLTVEENVELPLTYRAGMPSAERKKRVKEALERVNMAHRMKHYPAQLSGGQQQRVAVARAVGGSPLASQKSWVYFPPRILNQEINNHAHYHPHHARRPHRPFPDRGRPAAHRIPDRAQRRHRRAARCGV